jgi:uncharacterized membrane protein YdjX (TVP38/TMEM64 family)
VVLLLVILVVLVVSLDATFDLASAVIRRADQIVAAHKVGGAFLFVLLSALSAMVAFFSTAIVVPVAVGAWGKLMAVVLLWIGWLIGGALSYVIGRYLGRPVLRWFIDEAKLAPYEERLSGAVSFRHILLFQFALPSEIPGYVLGVLEYPFHTYVAALMVAELPFAIGAAYLGESFLRRDLFMIIALGIAGVLVTLAAASLFHSVFKIKPRR